MTKSKTLGTNTIRSFLTAGLFVLNFLPAFAQNDTVFIRYDSDKYDEKVTYKTDTVIFDTPNARQILYGTAVLPWTVNQQLAKNFGLYLDKVSITECKQELGKRPDEKNQVVSVTESKDSLIIEIKLWGNCCHSFLCDLQVVDDKTINLITYGYGATYCSCTCCYGLTFHIATMRVDEYKKLETIMVNNDRKTLKTK